MLSRSKDKFANGHFFGFNKCVFEQLISFFDFLLRFDEERFFYCFGLDIFLIAETGYFNGLIAPRAGASETALPLQR